MLVLACWCVSSPAASRETKRVSFAILEDYDKGQDLADVARDFALFERLEVRVWRGSFGWDDYEPSQGEYDFDWLHRFAELAGRHGIELRPYLAYTPEWAASGGAAGDGAWNNPPQRVEAFARFAGAVARAMTRHRNVASFEIYNEQNVRQWWEGSPSDYARVLRAGSRRIRQEHPRARVLLGGLVFPDADWIESVCGARAGAAFDILPLHAYPETWTPAGVTVENYFSGLDAFLASADAACGRKAIWINETGFATVPGKTERDQAAWWVRAVATFLAHPRVEHIGIYEIKDLPPGKPAIGDTPNYHLGLTRVDRTPKLAFHTVDMLTDLLDTDRLAVADGELVVEAEGASEVIAHMFVRPDGDRVAIVWTRDTPEHVVLRTAGGSVSEYLLDGTRLDRRGESGTVQDVELSPGVPRVFRISGR